MGIFSKLFEIGDSPQRNRDWNERQRALLVIVFSQQLLVEHVVSILGVYGEVLADSLDASQEEGEAPFFSESRLPYPRKTIEDAFLFVFTASEFLEMDDWFGAPKKTVEGAAHHLTLCFVPHVPDDPISKTLASLDHQYRVRLKSARRCELLDVPIIDDGTLYDLGKHGMTKYDERLLEWYPLDKNDRLKRVIEFAVTECRKHNFLIDTY